MRFCVGDEPECNGPECGHAETCPFFLRLAEEDPSIKTRLRGSLTNRQKTKIRRSLSRWSEDRFPRMTKDDFIRVCDEGSTTELNEFFDTLKPSKLEKEWLVPESLIRQEAANQFYAEAEWYKDAESFGESPSSVAIEQSTRVAFAPFFEKDKVKDLVFIDGRMVDLSKKEYKNDTRRNQELR